MKLVVNIGYTTGLKKEELIGSLLSLQFHPVEIPFLHQVAIVQLVEYHVCSPRVQGSIPSEGIEYFLVYIDNAGAIIWLEMFACIFNNFR